MNDDAPEAEGGGDLQLIATAFHEAGHAVMAVSLGRSIQKVTVSPGNMQAGGMRLGICEIKKGRSKNSSDALEDDVLILLSGMVAESHATGTYNPDGAAQDLMAVRRLLSSRARNEKALERLHRRLLDKTEHILGDAAHMLAIKLVAQELLSKTSISGRAVRHYFEQATKQCS